MTQEEVLKIWKGDKRQCIYDLHITGQGFGKWKGKKLSEQQMLHVFGAALLSGKITIGDAKKAFNNMRCK